MTPAGFSEVDSSRPGSTKLGWRPGQQQFALPGEVSTIDTLLQQARDVTLYTLPVDHFMKTVQVSDAELGTIRLNRSQFMSPDQVKISYVLLNAEICKARSRSANKTPVTIMTSIKINASHRRASPGGSHLDRTKG